ncbi:hypothetical protein F2Q69_00018877 [Brassica cretica]|uniref:CRM domain-containing protein n=1 Tax=Brassica cretica TaxID=69181 RepID=A0A8S9QJT9_BRACR|nr:hypothetical protein F2Q69_00018877 [Brassica cretica]
MVDAEKRLLANALLDESNQRFVLLSDSCIPLFDFTTIYDYLTGTNLSFIGSFDDPRKSGRGRYNPKMYPQINVTHWRKGSQWFSTTRELALHILADTFYYKIFDQHCKPPCYMDEHYIPTLVHMFHGEMSANRTLTWVDWSRVGPHPGRFIWPDITDDFLNRIRFTEECAYYGRDGENTTTSKCFLFARKFTEDTLEPLLRIYPLVLGSGRNHGLQGLASAILKLWERCVIAKIAIKWGALNTNNEEMADELKARVLILRNKYLIILFRGKDFLSDEVADLVDDRERLLRRYQHFEETKRESDIEISEVVADGEQLEETSKTGTLLEFQELQRKFGEMEVRNMESEAEKAKLEKELKSQEHKRSILKSKIEKTTTELLKLNSLWKPSARDDDIEILTNEERECLRRIGLKLNSSLVLGRRGVFDGVMEGLHQHWKHREVAKVITMQKLFSRVVYTAKSLEAESNGVLISIEKLKEGHAILMYRGRNYKRPSSKLMAQNLLTKRKALQRSVLMQRLGSLKFFAYQRERAIEDLKLSLVKLQGSASELC